MIARIYFDVLSSLTDMSDKSYIVFIKLLCFYLTLTTLSMYSNMDTKILAINLFIVMIPITAIVYTTAINSGTQNNDNRIRCDNTNGIRVKMFDSEIVPKYIIGKDYKIIPVNPATTDVLVNECTLSSQAISQ
jgi:hypothetical protein